MRDGLWIAVKDGHPLRAGHSSLGHRRIRSAEQASGARTIFALVRKKGWTFSPVRISVPDMTTRELLDAWRDSVTAIPATNENVSERANVIRLLDDAWETEKPDDYLPAMVAAGAFFVRSLKGGTN